MEKIQNYAFIGNGRSVALISQNGSIDWLCWPKFDSASLFGAILDDQAGGFWKIFPRSTTHSVRRYLDETNVLQTRFTTSSGTLCLTDFMTALSEEEKQRTLQPEHELIRELFCESGEVEIDIHFNPRPHYGQQAVILRDLGKLGIRFENQQSLTTLISDVPLTIGLDGAKTTLTLKKGEKRVFILTHAMEGPAVLPSLQWTAYKLQSTLDWWNNWAAQCRYQGPYRKEVVRSALTLKLLSFAPSGAFIASPTTSLPEKLGSHLNWDYRFCWLRDAAFTVRALFSLGYQEDAIAFVSWLLHSTRLSLPKLNPLYDVYGKNTGKETFLSHLKGYANSQPVRIGNAAQNQIQHDCYGEVIDAVASLIKEGGPLDGETKKMLRNFGKYICKHWQEPDNGVWEYRESQEHYTYSKVMCWVALDRLIAMNEKRWMSKSLLKRFIKNRDSIRLEIEEKGWNAHLQSYTAILYGETLDASLMLMSFYGFEKTDSERMQNTYLKIKERLYASPTGLIYREERSKGQEGAFLMCSFWNPEFLARGGGTLAEAKESFVRLCALANDVGLFAEEVDVETHDALGNFPQAFTHIALINAALAIEARERSIELE